MLAMWSRVDGVAMKIKCKTDLIAEKGNEDGSMQITGGVTIGIRDATKGEALIACGAILSNIAQELASHLKVDVDSIFIAAHVIGEHKAQVRTTKEVFGADENEA